MSKKSEKIGKNDIAIMHLKEKENFVILKIFCFFHFLIK